MAKILVIDDEIEIRNLLQDVLEGAGHSVSVAEDGGKGLLLFEQQDFDLIITDLIMPDKEGLETIKEMQSRRPGAKIIAISGGGQAGPVNYLKMAELFGAQMTLEKPFKMQELVECVESLLEA